MLPPQLRLQVQRLRPKRKKAYTACTRLMCAHVKKPASRELKKTRKDLGTCRILGSWALGGDGTRRPSSWALFGSPAGPGAGAGAGQFSKIGWLWTLQKRRGHGMGAPLSTDYLGAGRSSPRWQHLNLRPRRLPKPVASAKRHAPKDSRRVARPLASLSVAKTKPGRSRAKTPPAINLTPEFFGLTLALRTWWGGFSGDQPQSQSCEEPCASFSKGFSTFRIGRTSSCLKTIPLPCSSIR